MTKKYPGRPRLYDAPSGKVDAFRKRQESAGYLRKEVLVTKENWNQISALAAEHAVGVVDAASGLLEFGLQAFADREFAEAAVSRSVDIDRMALPRQPELDLSDSSETSAPPGNPITQFFAKRKEIQNGQAAATKPTKAADTTEK